jgi:hypothetical protein
MLVSSTAISCVDLRGNVFFGLLRSPFTFRINGLILDCDVIAFGVCGAHSSSAHFAHSLTHARSLTHSPTHTHTRTRARTHTHTHTHTRKHTHTHTHTCLNAHDRTCVCALQNDPRNFLRSLFARTSRRRMQLIATLTRHSWCDAPLALPVANLGLGHGQP